VLRWKIQNVDMRMPKSQEELDGESRLTNSIDPMFKQLPEVESYHFPNFTDGLTLHCYFSSQRTHAAFKERLHIAYQRDIIIDTLQE
jgi:hypothetical protein